MEASLMGTISVITEDILESNMVGQNLGFNNHLALFTITLNERIFQCV